MISKKIHSIRVKAYQLGSKDSFLITLCGHKMNAFSYFVRYNQQTTSRREYCKNCAKILFEELNIMNLNGYRSK